MEHHDKQDAQEPFSVYQDIVDNPKVPLTLRVGIAGPRHLTGEQQNQIVLTTRDIMRDIAQHLCDLIEHEPITARLYSVTDQSKPIVRLTTSLAQGTDRLIMHKHVINALQGLASIEYSAVLPFLPELCEQEANDALARPAHIDNELEFSALYQRIEQQAVPRIIALDGDISDADSRDQAHYRCAQFLAQNIDVLLLVSPLTPKSSPRHHKAGTAATKALALAAGVPCIEIHIDSDTNASSVTLCHSPKFDERIQAQPYSVPALAQMLRQIILFTDILKLPSSPDAADRSAHSALSTDSRGEKILRQFEAHIHDKSFLKCDPKRTPDFEYSGPIYSPVSTYERIKGLFAFDSFKRLAANEQEIAKAQQKITIVESVIDDDDRTEKDPAIQFQHRMFGHFLRADSLAIRYASIHRSTYLLIYLFAASALITAAAALTFQKYHALVAVLMVIEAFYLYRIYRLYKIDHGNHHRWLQNRCLAEAIRPNIYLGPMGRSFSFIRLKSSNEYMYRDLLGHQESGAEWVCIQAELIQRHHGFGKCIFHKDAQKVALNFLKRRWISGQIKYHQVNTTVMQNIGARLSGLTLALFFMTVAALSIKAGFFIAEKGFGIGVSEHPLSYLLYKLSGFFTAVFPILATAVFAIRNHSELDISAQRSRSMLAFFNGIVSKLNLKISTFFDSSPQSEIEHSVTSEIFASELNELTAVSSKEVSDWLEIYEVKESEPG